jgi:REP element-mobilizing transposase RayT
MNADPLSYKISYRRNLPHIQPPGASLFITFSLVGSLPATVRRALQAEAKAQEERLSTLPDPAERARQQYLQQIQHFGRWDKALDTEPAGPHWLKDPQVAQTVVDSIHYLDGRFYELDSFCIMSNHVHLLMTPLQETSGNYYSLAKIMHSLKGYTARRANAILGRQGQFWQHESYDHIVRDPAELLRIRHYILQNPVKASLVERWADWPYSYCAC